jgi:hypothetical protein
MVIVFGREVAGEIRDAADQVTKPICDRFPIGIRQRNHINRHPLRQINCRIEHDDTVTDMSSISHLVSSAYSSDEVIGGDRNQSLPKQIRDGSRFERDTFPAARCSSSNCITAARGSNSSYGRSNAWLRHPVHQHSQLFTRADVERLLSPDLSIVACGRSNIIPRNPANPLPAWLRDSPTFVAGLNLLDDGLTAFPPVFAQNWFFVLRKRSPEPAHGSHPLIPSPVGNCPGSLAAVRFRHGLLAIDHD